MTNFTEFLETMQPGSQPSPRITLAWEVLPDLDGALHAVDPDPDSYLFGEILGRNPEYAISLCGRTLVAKEGRVELSDLCSVCQQLSRERQAEFDAEAGR